MMFNWIRNLKNKFHSKKNEVSEYPSIKIAVRIGEITLYADSPETLKELMKILPPNSQESLNNAK